jgi:hypothetical protein
MSQAQEYKTVQPPIMRSEELLDRMGQNIGSLAALTRQRIQQTATRVGAGLVPAQTAQNGQPKQPEGSGPIPQGRMPQAEMHKAEELVDNMGQRLSLLTSIVGLQVRKTAAYAREGTEDILAEAQHLRSARRGVLT